MCTGTIVDCFIETNLGRDGREWSKRYIDVRPDGMDTIYNFLVEYKLDNMELEVGSRIQFAWKLRQFGQKRVKFSSCEIIEVFLESSIRQGSDMITESVPMPEYPTVPGGDSDFVDPETGMPF
jgi:hypothetical protein